MNDSDRHIKTAIKIAAVVFTAPATFEVAGTLYPGWAWYTRLPIQLAGLMLVEGALLLGWHRLDTNDKAESAQRWLYTAIAGLGYFSLLYISFLHEGARGWIFRLTLLAVLAYSVVESGIVAQLQDQRRADRNIDAMKKVKQERRKLEEETRILELRSEHRIKRLAVEIDAQGREAALQLASERDSKRRKREHREELREIEPESTPTRGQWGYPIDKLNADRELQKSERLEYMSEFIDHNPDLKPSDYVEWAVGVFHISESTAWNYWSELKPEPSANGNGHR